MADSVEWKGLDTLQAILRETPKNADQWLGNELFDAATEAFNESQVEVPVDTGALRGSGTVQMTSDNPVEVSIGYGGSSASYALAVHENLAARHKAPTKAKYLEDPVNKVMATQVGIMQGTVEGAIIGHIPGRTGAMEKSEAAAVKDAVKGRRGRHLVKGRVMPKPMSEQEIHEAIATIDRGHEMRSKGRRAIRTWHLARRPKT